VYQGAPAGGPGSTGDLVHVAQQQQGSKSAAVAAAAGDTIKVRAALCRGGWHVLRVCLSWVQGRVAVRPDPSSLASQTHWLLLPTALLLP
jgi:hypothetical protein